MHNFQILHIFFVLCYFFMGLPFGKGQVASEAQQYFEGTISYEVQLTGADADFIKANEPNTKMDLHLKKGNYIVNLMGGKYPKTFLFIADSNREYLVDASKQSAYRHSTYSDRINEQQEENPVAKPTGKQVKVNGVLCDIYLLKQLDTYFAYYVNDEYRVDESYFPDSSNSNASFLVKGLEGRIPLKTIKKQQRLTVTTTCTAIKPREFDPREFMIPPDFRIFNRDYRY